MGLIADVFEATLIKSDGSVLATTTLQDANIEVAVQENEVRGGRGNNILYTLHAGRDITTTLTDPEFRYDMLALQLGQNIITGSGIAYAAPENVITTGTTTVGFELKNEAVAGSVIIYDADGVKVDSSKYTVVGKKVTMKDGTVGEKYVVRSYQYVTNTKTETIEIDGTKFATGVKLVLETIEINQDEEPIALIQYQFDKAIPSGNFTISTASERTGSTNELSMKIVKPVDSDLIGRVLRIPLDSNGNPTTP